MKAYLAFKRPQWLGWIMDNSKVTFSTSADKGPAVIKELRANGCPAQINPAHASEIPQEVIDRHPRTEAPC